MTRKDYVLLSDAIKSWSLPEGGVRHQTRLDVMGPSFCRGYQMAHADTARAVADALAQDNPRFDRARFLKACGVAQ